MATTATKAGLVEACVDRRLLGFKLWPRQREILAAVEHGPRLHVWALGRRSGKTTMAALVGLWDCLLRPELAARVRPGERRHAVAVATNLRQARLFVRAALSIVERSPLLSTFVESVADDEITFTNGTALSAFPCTSRGARGWPISTLLLDESAHFIDTEGNQAAEPIWRSLVPSTAQFGDAARVIVSSTPWGTEGLFADLYARAANGEIEDALAQHRSSAEMNPTLDPALLEREHARDPDGYRAEYLAEFLGSGGAFLDPERIAGAVADRSELAPGQAADWIAGLDPAFSSDPFGLALVGRDPADRQRLVLGLAQAWKPSRKKAGSFEERRAVEDAVLAEAAETCLRYGARVVSDQYLARPVVDYLRRRGVTVRIIPMSAASKTAAFTELRARLYTGALELYEQPTLLAELRRLRTRYAAGSAAVVNPRVGGSHGDMAQALALAVFEAGRLRGDGSPDGATFGGDGIGLAHPGRNLRSELVGGGLDPALRENGGVTF